MTRKIIKGFIYFLCLIVYRVKKVGEENVPKTGSYIICGNHVHALDAVALVVSAKRKIIFVAKEELYKNKFIKWLGGVFDVITIKRNSGDIDAIKKCMKVLKTDEILGIFPEGTRNGMKKNAEIKTGAAFLALKTGTPVIPVGIQGTFKPFTKVILNFGKPMEFKEYQSNKPQKENLEKVSDEIMEEVIKLTKQQV